MAVIDGDPGVGGRSVLDQPGLALRLALGLAQWVRILRARDRIENWRGANDACPDVVREGLTQHLERVGLAPARAQYDVHVQVLTQHLLRLCRNKVLGDNGPWPHCIFN